VLASLSSSIFAKTSGNGKTAWPKITSPGAANADELYAVESYNVG
jgi:hypothetical protein